MLGAGRTDRGVHATGQVAAVTVPARWKPSEFRRAANAVLPRDVWVRGGPPCPGGFHPGTTRSPGPTSTGSGWPRRRASPFRRPWCWPLRGAVDGAAAREAAAAQIAGERSFAAFAKAGQPERGTAAAASTGRPGAAGTGWASRSRSPPNRYLHHMVRYLVGTMLDVARGRRPLAELHRAAGAARLPGRDLPAGAPRGPLPDRGELSAGSSPGTEPERKPRSRMKIFIDTADLSEIRRATEAGLIDGITTNPSLMAQERRRAETQREHLPRDLRAGGRTGERGGGRDRPRMRWSRRASGSPRSTPTSS